MRICLVTERNKEVELSAGSNGDTNDFNIAYLMGADKHFWMGDRDLTKFENYDIIVFKMSKIREKYERTWHELINLVKEKYPKKILMLYQEAEMIWPIFRSIDEQCELIKQLPLIDLFLLHNNFDDGFYGTFTKTLAVPTPLPLDRIKESARSIGYRRRYKKIIFGSTFDDRAYAMLGLCAAKRATHDIPEAKLVQYTRTKYDEDRNGKIRKATGMNFETIPQTSWLEFCDYISESYISMNLMPAAAAGRDTIAFAALGIPHIGNYMLDPMQTCFPRLCVDPLDIKKASSILRELLVYDSFYDEVVQYAKDAVDKHHSFDAVKSYLKTNIKEKLGIDL